MSVRSVTLTARSSLRSAGIGSTGSSFGVVVAAQARSGSVPTKFSRQSLNFGAMLPPLWQTPAVNRPVRPSESPSLSTNTAPEHSAAPVIVTTDTLLDPELEAYTLLVRQLSSMSTGALSSVEV